MAEDIVIRAEGLGKKYILGHQAEREGGYIALRDVLASRAHGVFRKAADVARGRALIRGDMREEFWALRDVNFEVRRGEVLGIIGRNGAGKSTLLKILSRITEPTTGRVTIKGRVASLLEVGTGFHPELTGRENIYLNGAILGMTRAEIKRKFDEIVAFSEIEKFLDTPVKRYSSGMYVRLAFAVAAHLEPEILVVDEVLAVGDAEFQKKSLGKMSEVAQGGRTVLFVSHNMPAVSSLCSEAILLQNGKVTTRGRPTEVLEAYLGNAEITTRLQGRRLDASVTVNSARLLSEPAVMLVFEFVLRGPLREPRIGIGINTSGGQRIATILSDTAGRIAHIEEGRSQTVRITTEPARIAPGTLTIKVALAERGQDIEIHDDALRVIIPDYSPFTRTPSSRPRGALFLTSQLAVHEEADPLEA
ncbi:MAG: polysaccharide ABC transporter ATP-binding protein [Stellaceae bacterium]